MDSFRFWSIIYVKYNRLNYVFVISGQINGAFLWKSCRKTTQIYTETFKRTPFKSRFMTVFPFNIPFIFFFSSTLRYYIMIFIFRRPYILAIYINFPFFACEASERARTLRATNLFEKLIINGRAAGWPKDASYIFNRWSCITLLLLYAPTNK